MLYKTTGMEFEIMRVCDGGRRVEKHVRLAGRTRGSLSIVQEADQTRRRAVLVARLAPAGGQRAVPPLYDVVLVGTSGDRWILSGFERIEAGPLRLEHALGQTWVVEPVAVQDLIEAERRWIDAVRDANELRERLTALGSASGQTAR
jgi:hypothetical protein